MRANERVFVVGEDGIARLVDEDISTTVYFRDEGELYDFESWLENVGGESFEKYRGSERDYPEICINCKWFDHSNFQCYDGHAQYPEREECEGFEEYE